MRVALLGGTGRIGGQLLTWALAERPRRHDALARDPPGPGRGPAATGAATTGPRQRVADRGAGDALDATAVAEVIRRQRRRVSCPRSARAGPRPLRCSRHRRAQRHGGDGEDWCSAAHLRVRGGRFHCRRPGHEPAAQAHPAAGAGEAVCRRAGHGGCDRRHRPGLDARASVPAGRHAPDRPVPGPAGVHPAAGGGKISRRGRRRTSWRPRSRNAAGRRGLPALAYQPLRRAARPGHQPLDWAAIMSRYQA